MSPRLTDAELNAETAKIPAWNVREGKLHREYAFADFTLAFGFMAAAATVIQGMNHHPEWSNVYGKVVVDLVTHDAGGITMSDVKLATKLEAIAAKLLG